MNLEEFFHIHPRIVIAFSGGSDSSYLLYRAKQSAGEVLACYMDTPLMPAGTRSDVERFCAAYDIPLEVRSYDILRLPDVRDNPPDRCYHCKTAMMREIRQVADAHGIPCVADGTNASDDPTHRPGMRALTEQGIESPLRLCGLTKADIRADARRLGLPTADMPSYACLAIAVPAGETLTPDALRRAARSDT